MSRIVEAHPLPRDAGHGAVVELRHEHADADGERDREGHPRPDVPARAHDCTSRAAMRSFV